MVRGYDSTANIKDKESLSNVPTTVTLIAKNVKTLVDDIHVKYDALCDAAVAFNKRIPPKDSDNDMVITFNTVIKKSEKFTEDDSDFNWVNENLEKFGEVKTPEDLRNDAINDNGIFSLEKAH
jgi:hypothetical protein